MQRVRKVSVVVESFVKPDGLSICLACWKDWMQSDDRGDLAASRMQLDADRSEIDPVAYENDPWEDQRRADFKVGEATGAMINSLKACWRWAIYRKCGITTVWDFPSLNGANFTEAVESAEKDLEIKLKKNIVTSHKF